ncbi:MAG: PIN domain-containing protein [Candidatus Levybacteria bacterium]|nr:PIN domain-containing protein [Candidatus Levybacteria bacterium]
MMFIDTNYILRFLLKDINNQHLTAKNLFLSASEGKSVLITSTIVFFEIYWVLSSYYERNKTEVANVLEKVLSLNFIKLEERELLFKSLSLFKKINLDLEDCYNICYAKSKGIRSFKTFDKKLDTAFGKN